MRGWIRLHRKFIEWEWYSDINTKVLFIHLLLKANHKENKWQGIIIKRGQLVTSVANLSEELGLTIQQTRTSLSKLKSTGEITTKTTNKYSLVTIEKYELYQDNDFEITSKITNKIANEQQTNNKQNNNQITTNNNDNNIENDNNENNNIYLFNYNKKIKEKNSENFSLFVEGDEFDEFLKNKGMDKDIFDNLDVDAQDEIVEEWFREGYK